MRGRETEMLRGREPEKQRKIFISASLPPHCLADPPRFVAEFLASLLLLRIL